MQWVEMSGYEKSPDYGGEQPGWGTFPLIGLFILVLIAGIVSVALELIQRGANV